MYLIVAKVQLKYFFLNSVYAVAYGMQSGGKEVLPGIPVCILLALFATLEMGKRLAEYSHDRI
jgi:hypothetical protein